jgi:transcriptional regulator with XRE-family HTH domain
MTTRQDKQYARFLEQLKMARLKSGLTQAEVAKRIGRPQSFVSKCESGERRIDVVELAELAKLYGQPVTYFLDSSDRKSG